MCPKLMSFFLSGAWGFLAALEGDRLHCQWLQIGAPRSDVQGLLRGFSQEKIVVKIQPAAGRIMRKKRRIFVFDRFLMASFSVNVSERAAIKLIQFQRGGGGGL